MARTPLLNVRARCRCGGEIPACVRVDRQVPPKLQCVPSGAGGSGGDGRIRCPRCRHVCFESIQHLEKASNAATQRPNWGHFMEDGFVPVSCEG